MNARELIASGLLEAYVLGDGSGEERALVQRMAAENAEVKAELEAIEQTLEDHAFAGSVEAPVRVRAQVMAAIGAKDGPVRPLVPAKTSTWNWLVAATVAALLFSGAGNVLLYGELHQAKGRVASLENERAVMADRMQVQEASMKNVQGQLAVVFDPERHIVPLSGQVIEPKAAARVYMDPKTSDVYLDVLSLPKPPPGKQYQLWGQVNGKMVDAGMLDLADEGVRLQHMKAMPNATAFGVTLENEGGSATPTLTALYLFGQVG